MAPSDKSYAELPSIIPSLILQEDGSWLRYVSSDHSNSKNQLQPHFRHAVLQRAFATKKRRMLPMGKHWINVIFLSRIYPRAVKYPTESY